MSYAEIEAELDKLDANELRQLALKSWTAFMRREGLDAAVNECDEADPRLLAALDEATASADATSGNGLTGAELRARLGGWISR